MRHTKERRDLFGIMLLNLVRKAKSSSLGFHLYDTASAGGSRMDQTFVLVRLAGKPWCSNNVSSIHANGVKMIVDSTASRRADSIYM